MMSREEEILKRGLIVAVAQSWLNTPFVDQQGMKGCGVDCAYLLARVAEEAGMIVHVEIPRYSPQIYLNKRGDDTYLRILQQYAYEIPEYRVKPGDMILYKQAASYTHGGIIESWPDKIINPMKLSGVVYSNANEGLIHRRAKKFFRFNAFPE